MKYRRLGITVEQSDTWIWHKMNAGFRYMLLHTATGSIPYYVVNEYPKSGGSWIASMMSDAIGVPFPRNRLPRLDSSILHGHIMQAWNIHNMLLVWRDGRDVVISQYFHSLFENDRGNHQLVAQCRKELMFTDYADVKSNLPEFIEYVFVIRNHPRFSWSEFVDRWVSCDNCAHVKYEDLRTRPIVELIRLTKNLAGIDLSVERAKQITDKYSFERISGRRAGVEDSQSFLRKGIIGDWKNYFDSNCKDIFNTYAGRQLIKLGYEKDNSWVPM